MYIVPCPDTAKQNLKNKEVMKAAGWNFGSLLKINDSVYKNQCKDYPFWAYQSGIGVGSISTVFQGSGSGTIIFGNCYLDESPSSKTTVSLNDNLIGTATKTKVTLNFNFTKGDILEVEEINTGILGIYSFHLECINEM